ncbi:hypothetical protein PMAYCL1PPCAC_04345 [Pristionchus mayeri]|uniref:Bestrophin homolog n=1 Tax=Pristionchus mayeri TaxID=1317129 RepID=A0AAN4ZAE0_9BILA|nr:hypothetical protein PMAYCL1PPCAC_04345 [Pristionchus mayeri]
MTVTYTLEVSRARFWGFPKLLIRWKGSIYRLMYLEMTSFLALFYLIMTTYRWGLSEENQRRFEMVALYCRDFTLTIPITFVMGFYVTFVAGRWWQQYMNIPWPDRIALQVSAYVSGSDERGRLMRRALVRYANLLAIFTFQSTSTVIKRRFPTIDHLLDAGLLTEEEKRTLESIHSPQGTWFVPAHWFCQLATIARKEGRIHDDLHLKSLIDEMMTYRGQCGMIWSYDWISVPLVYTQVVTIAVYSFFTASLFGRQYLITDATVGTHNVVDSYVPFYTVVQFCFYVGWLKVAESMICPFGEDDDDFELNWIIDRNVQVSYLLADTLHLKHPRLTRDIFWNTVEPDLPYTAATSKDRRAKDAFMGSTQAMNINVKQSEWDMDELPPIGEMDEDRAEAGMNHNSKRASTILEDDLEGADGDDAGSVISCSSTNTELKFKKRGRLATLLLGSSRQTLFSKSGSKRSMFQRSTDASYPNLDANSQEVSDPYEDSPGSNSSQRVGTPLSQMVSVPPVVLEESEVDSAGERTLTQKEGKDLAARIKKLSRTEEVEREEDLPFDSSQTPLFLP